MIMVLQNMPPGTLGLEAVGKVTEDDFRGVLVPTVDSRVLGPHRRS